MSAAPEAQHMLHAAYMMHLRTFTAACCEMLRADTPDTSCSLHSNSVRQTAGLWGPTRRQPRVAIEGHTGPRQCCPSRFSGTFCRCRCTPANWTRSTCCRAAEGSLRLLRPHLAATGLRWRQAMSHNLMAHAYTRNTYVHAVAAYMHASCQWAHVHR